MLRVDSTAVVLFDDQLSRKSTENRTQCLKASKKSPVSIHRTHPMLVPFKPKCLQKEREKSFFCTNFFFLLCVKSSKRERERDHENEKKIHLLIGSLGTRVSWWKGKWASWSTLFMVVVVVTASRLPHDYLVILPHSTSSFGAPCLAYFLTLKMLPVRVPLADIIF